MASIELEIEGSGAIAATQALTQLEGLSVTYETEGGGDTRETILATIATIVGITAGTLEIAKKLYEWYQKYRQQTPAARIEKVVLVGRNGQRIRLENASIDQIKQILDSE
jgi:hypothetical protein